MTAKLNGLFVHNLEHTEKKKQHTFLVLWNCFIMMEWLTD